MAQLKSTIVQGALTVTSNVVANKLIKLGGTASQILMADGSVKGIGDLITIPNISITDTGTKPIVGDITSSGHTITVTRIGLDDLGLASAYKYKGSVAKYENLPTSDQEVGDVWNVTDTGMNYAWNDTAWDALGATIDTSNFVSATKNTGISVAGTSKVTYTYDKTAIFAPNGLIMGGSAAAAGLVTRGICGVSVPDSTTGACTKDNLYLNYDGNNTWNAASRAVIINAGTLGDNLGSGMYEYAAVRGDIVKAWVEDKKYLTSHQSIKTLKTDNTTAQTVSASEAIAGSGTINLHKISKTGSYNDLLDKPSIPNPADYYWANVKVSTSSSTSTKPTFANNFLVNIATNNVLTPGADWAIASAIPKYLWHDLLPFRAAKAEYSTDGTTWTEDTTDKYRRTLTNQKENQTITVLSDSRPYARFTWDGGSAIWHACQADWLVIGFAYASPAAQCSIKFQYSTDGTTWTDSLSVGASSYNSAPSWFKINSSFSQCRAVRLVLTRTNSSGTLNLSSVKWLTKRWGNQGMGSELEKPYSWDNNASLYYRNSSSTLGLSSAPWSAIYGTTIYEGGTSLSSKYQAKDEDLTAISALTGTGLLKRTGENTWALDANSYLTSESDTLQTVTDRGATTTKSIEVAGLKSTGNVSIYAASGSTPYLLFQRGTDTDSYNDWGVYGTGGSLYFKNRGSGGTWGSRVTFLQDGGITLDAGNLNVASGTATANSFIKRNSSDSYVLLGGGGHKALSELQSAGNYVTIDTEQTITGKKTFDAPTNASGEQATTVFKTANGGSITIGKEGSNSGTMLRFDQTHGTCRLRFRASSTAGAMVWEQPESNSSLYLDVSSVDFRNTTSIRFSNFKSAGYLYTDSSGNLKSAAFPTIPTVNNGTLTIQKNGTNVATFTANQSGDITANITVPTKTSDLTNDSNFITAEADTLQSVTTRGATTNKSITALSYNINSAVTMEYDSSYKALKFVFA